MATTRPKGYMDWQPKHGSEAESVINATREILREYGSFGPMTVRQIFYRLVGAYGYDKTEKAYKRLAENLVKARRAQLIRFNQIRDDGGTTVGGPTGFRDLSDFLEDMADWGNHYRIDKSQGQPFHIEMFCEAEGMVPMLGQILQGTGVRITGTGGFSSLTVTHGIAQKVSNRDVPTIFMHVGDYDPSGESIFMSMSQDIGKFVAEIIGGNYFPSTGKTNLHPDNDGPDFRPMRVALTEDQVEEFDLPTAPPKASDSRSANWIGETTQAEAMPPDLLERVVLDAVNEFLDHDKIAELEEQEEEERELLGSKMTEAINAIREELDR